MRGGSAPQSTGNFNKAEVCHLRPSKLASVWRSWIHQFAPWTHAATVTFQRFHAGSVVSEAIMVAALRHFLRVIDVEIYGRRGAERGLVVPSVVVLGWGTYRDHPHAHLALQSPTHMPSSAFIQIVHTAADKTFWLDKEKQIKPYCDIGWSAYLIDHDPENLVLPLLREERSTSSAAASTT